MPTMPGTPFPTATLEVTQEARYSSRIGLVGNSKKMTVVYWFTPFAAAVTILFDQWSVDPVLVAQFWAFFKLAVGGFLGIQGLGDAIERGVGAIRKPQFTIEPGISAQPIENVGFQEGSPTSKSE